MTEPLDLILRSITTEDRITFTILDAVVPEGSDDDHDDDDNADDGR